MADLLEISFDFTKYTFDVYIQCSRNNTVINEIIALQMCADGKLKKYFLLFLDLRI